MLTLHFCLSELEDITGGAGPATVLCVGHLVQVMGQEISVVICYLSLLPGLQVLDGVFPADLPPTGGDVASFSLFLHLYQEEWLRWLMKRSLSSPDAYALA